eukprot:CAMPEP_0177218272 /NCGR_PEP_ID=MMETSP0367-20130122/35727_1 /TAXON_ID=447022 ORGANISM="Scrippsiella hangoei-like, Strain SHHI-4" /NCGR_SAMPLE_ID=MMETSP0367 /ASSEMBLY_ACC=CAM_ASM_000362 /LENGTH=247 /DNA_ID=CAMNT_0018667893 /DNA_START=189 /DNA_END=929 /DNA_ORIENTATION=+
MNRVPTCDQALLHLDDHQSGARLGVAQVEAVRDAAARLQCWQITIKVRRGDADFGGALDDHRPDVVHLKALGHLIDVPTAAIHLHDPVALLQTLLRIARVPALDGAGMDRDDDGRQLVYHVDSDPEFAMRRASWRRLHGAHLRGGQLGIRDEAEPQLLRLLPRRQLGAAAATVATAAPAAEEGEPGGLRSARSSSQTLQASSSCSRTYAFPPAACPPWGFGACGASGACGLPTSSSPLSLKHGLVHE